MQTIGIFSNTAISTVYNFKYKSRGKSRSEQRKKDYSAERYCNSFLKNIIPPIAPQTVVRQCDNEEYNCITKENYAYLLESAMNYASLSGVELKHNAGKSIGEGISNIYDELNKIIGDINLNIEFKAKKLVFVLWKYHQWGKFTFYWLPVKFVETLNPPLRKIAISFLHRFIRSNGLTTINDSQDTEMIFEIHDDEICNYDEENIEENLQIFASYKSGTICNLMNTIMTKCHHKNLPEALSNYVPNNEFEQQLIDLFIEGLQFIGKDKPSIMNYGYDPYSDEEEREYYPVEMDRMIRIVYDTNDFVSEWMMEITNTELRESYDISPVTQLTISPETTELFAMDRYPETFFIWFDKICTLL